MIHNSLRTVLSWLLFLLGAGIGAPIIDEPDPITRNGYSRTLSIIEDAEAVPRMVDVADPVTARFVFQIIEDGDPIGP